MGNDHNAHNSSCPTTCGDLSHLHMDALLYGSNHITRRWDGTIRRVSPLLVFFASEPTDDGE